MTSLSTFEMEEVKKYSVVQGTMKRPKINEFVIFANNSKKHELGKFDVYWTHRQQGCKLITECYLGQERCDVVCLTCGERYEIETDPHRATRFIGRPINVVMV